MVFRRRNRGYKRRKRSNYRYRRNMKKQMLAPHIGGKLKQPIHYFTRFADYSNIVLVNGTTFTGAAYTFLLSDLPNFAEFTALYDWYKIMGVQFTMIPNSNVNLDSATTGVNIGTNFYNRVATVIDYNDDTTPTAMDTLRQYGNCKMYSNNRIIKRFFKPRPVVTMDEDAESGGTTGLGEASRKQWIATASNSTEYFALKVGIQHVNPGANFTAYNCEAKIYLAFKSVI